MALARHAMLIAANDFRTAFTRRRGRWLVAVMLLLGTTPGVVRIWIDAIGTQADRARFAQHDAAAAVSVFGVEAAEAVSKYPGALVSLAAITVLALPLLLLVAGYDAIAEEAGRGTLGFSILRTSAHAVVVGRFLGLWASMVAMIFAAQGLLCVALLAFGHVPPSQLLLHDAPRLFFACVISALPYAALAIAVSALFGSSSRSLMVGLAVLVALGLIRAITDGTGVAEHLLLPGANVGALLHSNLRAMLVASGSLALWAACALLFASLFLRRRSVSRGRKLSNILSTAGSGLAAPSNITDGARS